MSADKPLDNLDMGILKLLQENGRMSFSEMAKRLNASETTVRFRFKRMIRMGVIKKIVPVVNRRKLGLNYSAALMLRFNPSKLESALKRIKEFKEITQIYQLSGPYDAIAVVISSSMEELRKTINRVKNPGRR